MSTDELDVKVTRLSGVTVDTSVVSARTHTHKLRSFQDTRGDEECVNGASPEHLHSSKNLWVGRNILLKANSEGSDCAPGDQVKSSDQLRFTSFCSLRFPAKRSKWDTEDDHAAIQLSDHDVHRRSERVRTKADVHRQELWGKVFSYSTFNDISSKAYEDEDVSGITEGGVNQSTQNHFGIYISNRSCTNRIPCGVAQCGQTKTRENCTWRQSAGSEHLTEQRDTQRKPELGADGLLGENVEGTHRHSNLIRLREGGGLNDRTDCQSSACWPRTLKRASSLPFFPDLNHGNNTDTKPSRIIPTAAMFTSTFVSVLAPHWNLRRQKRGVNEVGQDLQVSGQNSNFTPSSQDARQKSFLLSHVQPRGEACDKFSNMLKGPATLSRNYVAWQKENSSPNPTPAFQSRRSLLESSSSEAHRQTVCRNAEFAPLPLAQVPKPALSAQLGGYKRMSQAMDQRESLSSSDSRTTSSSLLLSWRRNSRKASALSTQTEKQLPLSVQSLTMSRHTRLSASQPHTCMVSPGLPGGDKSPVSSRGRETEASRRPVLSNKRESDISNNTFSARSDTTRGGQFLSPATRLGHLEAVKGFQHHQKNVLERKYSVGNRESEKQSITSYTNVISNISTPHSTFDSPSTSGSLKDNTNSNFIQSHTEFNNGNVNSHSYYISDTKRQISQTAARSNHSTSASWQSPSTNNVVTFSKANTVNTPNTIASTSHTSPITVQSPSVSPPAAITPTSLSQDGQNSIQNSVKNKGNVCPEKRSTSPVNPVDRKTFTNSLIFSPRKEPSAVDGTGPSRVWKSFLNSQSSPVESDKPQTPSDLTSLPSPSSSRRISSLSIYTYLRETSPLVAMEISPGLSPACPQPASVKQDEGQTQRQIENAEASKFTFDLSPVESQDDWAMPQDSYTSRSPQSLPPDVAVRRSAHFTNSPYASLISARPALNSTLPSLSCSPVPQDHSRSASYESSEMHSNLPKTEKSTYSSLKGKDTLISWRAGKASNFVENQPVGKTSKTSSPPPDTRRSSQNSRDMDHQTVNCSIPDTTLPKEYKIISKNIPHQDNTLSSPSAKVKTYKLNYKDLSSPLKTPVVSETMSTSVRQGNMILPTHEPLQRLSGSPNSKTSLFSPRSEKNYLLFSAPSVDRGSEDDDLTVRRKSINQKPSDYKASKHIAKEEMYSKNQTLKSPNSSNTQTSCVKESLNSSSPVSGVTFRKTKQEILLNVDEHKRPTDENGNSSLRRSLSPNWPKHHHINRYATMPQSRKPSLVPSPPFYPFDFDSSNVQDDDVFYSPISRRRHSSLCETEDELQAGNTINTGRKHFTQGILSASCADLKYGLEYGRSVSVNCVFSGRPSGPGRISTGSKPGSTTDITSSDEFVTKSSSSSISNPCDSPRYGAGSPITHASHNTQKVNTAGPTSGAHLWSPVNLDTPLHPVHTDTDPTPPPSPTFSPTSRRMARVPTSSSSSNRTSPDSLSPRGRLPSRDYKSTLPVFEESPDSSESTTDDEYYLNSDDDDDDKETEL